MPDWDQDSPELRKNAAEALRAASKSAAQAETPTLDLARQWHSILMSRLEAPEPLASRSWIGKFRGEQDLEDVRVRVGDYAGTLPSKVAAELETFIGRMRSAVSFLEEALEPRRRAERAEHFRLVLQTAAWCHAEWVRIHPFANGNGRTARLWANWILMRFGFAPFIRIRPRPAGEAYGHAARESMRGSWRPTLEFFEALCDEFGHGILRTTSRTPDQR